MELKICNICKNFGETVALDNVSFSAQSGQPLGLLGRNGAGKTTAIRLIMNIFLPTSGHILLDGRPVSEMTSRLGYLPEDRGLYDDSPIAEQLVYIARLRGMSRHDAQKACDYWLERMEMDKWRKSKPSALSKGNKQRIQLILALINNPDVIILDEPFSGLDPVNAKQLRMLIGELSGSGKLVILSSHQMSAIETVCDHVVMLNRGRVALDSTLGELRRQSTSGTIKLRTTNDSLALSVASDFGTAAALHDGISVVLGEQKNQHDLLDALRSAPLDLLLFEVGTPSLEDLFVSICENASADTGQKSGGGEQK